MDACSVCYTRTPCQHVADAGVLSVPDSLSLWGPRGLWGGQALWAVLLAVSSSLWAPQRVALAVRVWGGSGRNGSEKNECHLSQEVPCRKCSTGWLAASGAAANQPCTGWRRGRRSCRGIYVAGALGPWHPTKAIESAGAGRRPGWRGSPRLGRKSVFTHAGICPSAPMCPSSCVSETAAWGLR